MRVIGIDPGTRVTGYGVIECLDGRKLLHITHGVIRTDASRPLWERLGTIAAGVRQLAADYPADALAIEQCFVSKNVSSALKLGHTRGAIMVVAMEAQLAIAEYAPTQIKSAVTGSGRSDKHQVAQMVRMILNLPKPASSDASDALAAAICHLHSVGAPHRVAQVARRRR